MQVSNFKELEKALLDIATNVLKEDVAPAVREVEIQKIETEVYDKYEPIMYKRRKTSQGGMQSVDSFDIEIGNNKNFAEVSLINNATFKTPDFSTAKFQSLSHMIEYGFYNGKTEINGEEVPAYMKPRPFVEPTQDKVKKNNTHFKAAKSGFEKLGYQVKYF